MANPYDETGENENLGPRELNEKEVSVAGIWEARPASDPDGPIGEVVVMLRDGHGRKLPISIGPCETMAIHNVLEKVQAERPLTHDLLRTIIERFGASVEKVIIDDLWQRTFYAKLFLTQRDGRTIEIDSRPSDAIALAVRFHAPIYVAEAVLSDAGQQDDDLS